MNSLKKVVIFGATSAIAQEVARQIVSTGGSVFCVGRNAKKLERLLSDLQSRARNGVAISGVASDLVDTNNHSFLIAQAEKFLDGMDAALICHGSLPDQKLCEKSFPDVCRELNVNAVSVISLLTELSHPFERQGYGVIAAITSVAGDRGRQSNYIYGAAKGMVSIFLQGLRNRLSKANVDVVTIKPGFVDTPMTEQISKSGLLWSQPEVIARGIVRAMSRGMSTAYLPWFWDPIMFLIRSIPERIFNRLSL